MNQTLTKMAVVQIKKRRERGKGGAGRCVCVCVFMIERQREKKREKERASERASGRMVLCCSGVRKSSPPGRIFKSLMPFKWCHHILLSLFLLSPSPPSSLLTPISLNIFPPFSNCFRHFEPAFTPIPSHHRHCHHHLPAHLSPPTTPPQSVIWLQGRGEDGGLCVTWHIRIMAEQDAKHLVFLWLMCFFF